MVETLDFYQIPPVVDTHIIFKRKTEDKPYSHFVNWDYDVALGAYDILETVQPNQLVITSYDTISGEIKGTFNLNFLVYHRPYPNAPDTVRFRDGRFHGKVNKQ